MAGSEQDPAGGDGDMCGYPAQRGPCQNPPTEGERCWIESHTVDPADPPKEVTDGRGAPEGNDNALGNPGGTAPEGNTNAMIHGLHMTAERLLEVMDGREQEELKSAFLEKRERCINDRQAFKLAVFDVMETSLMQEIIDEGMHEFIQQGEDPDDGFDRFMQEKIEAMQGFRREQRLGLHYEGASAQHQGSSGNGGHDNLDLLVKDAD